MIKLRDYQKKSLSMIHDFIENRDGNPCLVLPTGAGKSIVIAEFCRDAVMRWPETRILMLCRQKELIEQNREKLLKIWPEAPLGIYSSSIGRREFDKITFAGIQSVYRRADEIGHIDIVIVDECHQINAKESGSYRKLINDLTAINPSLRVLGLTASPYRMGHGVITDEPAIFSELIEPTSIVELVNDGYLSPLRSKLTALRLNVSGVSLRGGDFIESELQAAVNTDINNESAVAEIIRCGVNREHWLIFCAGVEHAKSIADLLNESGINTGYIHGGLTKSEREDVLSRYMSGELRAITNCNILTTGFDFPDIDMVCLLRPTMSVILYLQMVGRGMRIKSKADDCLVLDFAGNVMRHGPVINVQPPKKTSGGEPKKYRDCPECAEIVSYSEQSCPACGVVFEKKIRDRKLKLLADSGMDIMGNGEVVLRIKRWKWSKAVSKQSGLPMIVCKYTPLIGEQIIEYFSVMHPKSGDFAIKKIVDIGSKCGADLSVMSGEIDKVVDEFNGKLAPELILCKKKERFFNVLEREWA